MLFVCGPTEWRRKANGKETHFLFSLKSEAWTFGWADSRVWQANVRAWIALETPTGHLGWRTLIDQLAVLTTLRELLLFAAARRAEAAR